MVGFIVIMSLAFGNNIALSCKAKGVDPDKCFTKQNIEVVYDYPDSHQGK